MNRQIVQLFGLFAALFALLVVFTSRWTVFEAQSLEDNQANRRPLIEEQRVPRGLILANDGRTVLARSTAEGRGEDRIYTRTYPLGRLFAHPVGYSFIRNGRRSLELSRNDDLVGKEDEFESIFSGLEGRDTRGPATSSRTSTWPAHRPRSPAWLGARARWWRSSRRPARSG